MSRQKSKQSRKLRFSGPELPELLEHVVKEHGSTVEIAQVNRIRSGGVAGFFCREEFEVVVDGASGPDRANPSTSRARGRRARSDREPSADRITVRPNERRRGREVPSEGPPTLDSSDERFRALLEQRLEETGAAEASLARRSTNRQRPRRSRTTVSPSDSSALAVPVTDGAPTTPTATTETRPAADRTPTTNQPAATTETRLAADRRPATNQPAATTEITLIPGRPSATAEAARPSRRNASAGVGRLSSMATPRLMATTESSGPIAPSSFWPTLKAIGDSMQTLPRTPGLTVVVGPLVLAVPVVRRLQCHHRLGPEDVVVLTARAEIISEPTWRLVRSGAQLVDAAARREAEPTLLVIDAPVEQPIWVAPLLVRLRRAGVDLVRYAVPGSPDSNELEQYRAAPDRRYVIDLVSRVEPARLVKLVQRGHPVATVAGVGVTAELLLAMGGGGGPWVMTADESSS